MKFAIFMVVISFFLNPLYIEAKVVARMRFQAIMGHLHKNPSRFSSSLTTLQCGHPVKIIEDTTIHTPAGWFYAQVGQDKGYIQEHFLNATHPKCLQGRYQRFFNELNLDLSDMYYWGRLSDYFDVGETRP